MKTSKLKNLVLNIVFIFEICFPVCSQTFNFEFSSGLCTLMLKETLESKNTKLSELNWTDYLSFNFCFNGFFEYKGFYFGTCLGFLMPGEFGIATDTDYFVMGGISQFSKHDFQLEKKYYAEIDFGYLIDLGKVNLLPSAGIYFQNLKFSALNGYVQIPSFLNGMEEKKYMSGTGVSYEQKILLPSINLKINANINDRIKLGGSVKCCPYVISNCTDYHYFRNREYEDILRGGFFIGADVKFVYKKVGIKTSYEFIKTSKNSKTYKTITGDTKKNKELIDGYIPGFVSHAVTIDLSVKLTD